MARIYVAARRPDNPPRQSGYTPAMVEIPLQGPLVQSTFIERPNRFLLRCATAPGTPPGRRGGRAGEAGAAYAAVVEAHMADPGRLRELLLPGRRVWLRPAAPGPTRRTAWTAVLVQSPDGGGLVSVDTTLPNRLIHQALRLNALDEFAGWDLERREVAFGDSRIDFLLRRSDGAGLALEVKSVTLVEGGVALFPDAVTSRGARHLRELARVAAQPGWHAAVLFVLQRPDAVRIEAAASIDPVFARQLDAARGAGVRVYGRRCSVTLEKLQLGPAVPVA